MTIPAKSSSALATENPPDSLPEHYFDLYNLAVEMADRISTRRMLANSFFATVNTGLAVLLGSRSFPWYVPTAGIVLSLVWWALLKSYRDLNAAKYRGILKMEQHLPVQIFTDEWNILKGEAVKLRPQLGTIKAWLAQYRELGAVERVVPWVFAAIYLIDIVSRHWA